MCRMTEEIPCPQCKKMCSREDIVHWGWCSLCEHVEDETQTDNYYQKKEEQYGLEHE